MYVSYKHDDEVNESDDMVLLNDDEDDDVMVISDESNESIASNESTSNKSATTPPPNDNYYSSTSTLKTRLYNTITTNPIQKDSHGRPILPEMVVGSISHKGGECAVGLARLHPLFYEAMSADRVGGAGVDMDEVQWREDCPIYYDDEEEDDYMVSTYILTHHMPSLLL